MSIHLDPTVVSLIGALCGGMGLKALEHWLGRNKIRIDEAAQMRDELRVDITAQREEIRALEAEVDRWRKDYYDLRDKYTTLNAEYLIAIEKIKHEAELAKERVGGSDLSEKGEQPQ